MAEQCLVLKTRRAARAITRRYNALLRPHGLQSTQASLLFAISRGGFESIRELAELLAMERSALTRNLRLLHDAGLITSDQRGQGRAQRVRLSAAGDALLTSVLPLWFEAQDAMRAELGDDEWVRAQRALTLIGDAG